MNDTSKTKHHTAKKGFNANIVRSEQEPKTKKLRFAERLNAVDSKRRDDEDDYRISTDDEFDPNSS